MRAHLVLLCFILVFGSAAEAKTCVGQVFGIKDDYNQNAGGFLAVRTKPTASAEQINELHNDDPPVKILSKSGNWYLVSADQSPPLRGWVNGKWLRVSCR